jgi:hypothetical protein
VLSWLLARNRAADAIFMDDMRARNSDGDLVLRNRVHTGWISVPGFIPHRWKFGAPFGTKLRTHMQFKYLYKYNSSSAARGRRTNDGLGGNHTIAAFMFCAIEPLVCDIQEFVEGVSIASELRHPNTDGDIDRRSVSDIERTAFDG